MEALGGRSFSRAKLDAESSRRSLTDGSRQRDKGNAVLFQAGKRDVIYKN